MSQFKVSVDEKRGLLVIEAPINKELHPSKTGKTKIVASSNGNQATTVSVAGQPVVVGFNAYIKA